MKSTFFYLSVLLMFSGCLGFAPGIVWAWSTCALTMFGGFGFVLILSLSGPSQHVQHPDPQIRAAVTSALRSVAKTSYWLTGSVGLALIFAFAASGHTYLAIAVAVSTSIVFGARVKASEAIQDARISSRLQ